VSDSASGEASGNATAEKTSEAGARVAKSEPGAAWSLRDGLLLAVAFAVAMLVRAPIAAIPLERDEGEYAYIAQRWLAGDVPYRDAFDQKPPGVFVAYAAILRAFGSSPAAIHWGAQAYALGTLALVFAIGRRLFGARAGFAAALFAAFLSAGPGVLGNAANTETFMLLPLAGALLATLLSVERQSLRWAVVAGAASGCAVLFKQIALPNLVFCVAFLAWRSRRRAAATAAFLAGAAASVAPAPLYFAAAGAWRDFADCVIGHNMSYAARLPLAVYPSTFGLAYRGMVATWWPIVVLALIGFGAAAVSARRRDAHPARGGRAGPAARDSAFVIAAWGLASFAGVATGGYFRPHYFLQIVPAVALLAGAGAEAAGLAIAERVLGHRARRAPSFVPLFITGAALVVGAFAARWYFLPGDSDAKCRRIYGTNPFAESFAAGRLIAQRSSPNDRVFVYGSEPQILFHANRRSATRYIFVYPLTTSFPDTRDRQRAALAEIVESRPRHVVLVFDRVSHLLTPETPQDLADGVVRILNDGYQIVAVTPFRVRSPQDWNVEWVTGEPAQALWADHASKANQRMWCSLAIWERIDEEVVPEL